MTEKPQKDMIRELYQAVIGIKENPDDNGLIGDVKEVSDKLDRMNGRVRGNEVRSKVNQGLFGSGVIGVITKILGWW